MGSISLANNMGKNVIINPTFDFWQRGETFFNIANPGSGLLTADRYRAFCSEANMMNVTKGVDAEDKNYPNYLAISNNLTLGTLPSGFYCQLLQSIEGMMLRHLIGKKITIGFSVKSNVPGNYAVNLIKASAGVSQKSFIHKYTIHEANVWEEKTFKSDLPVEFDYNLGNTTGMDIRWHVAVGTQYQSSVEDEWQERGTGNMGIVDQADFFANSSNYLAVKKVFMYEGVDVHPFSQIIRPPQQELSLCQRYYEKSYDLETKPGTALQQGSIYHQNGAAGNYVYHQINFKVEKRAHPLGTCYNATNGTVNQLGGTSGPITVTGWHSNWLGTSGMDMLYCTSAVPVNGTVNYHWTADAEL